MIISFAWTTTALVMGRKKVTRRDWSRNYAARFREGTVHDGYSRQPRFGGQKVAKVEITRSPYPERCRDIPDADFELEGFAYMEEKGELIRGRTPREFFDNWRQSSESLYVVRFDLVFKCDRCGAYSPSRGFGYPENKSRLCPLCWVDWTYVSEADPRCGGSSAEWAQAYNEFCNTKGGRNE